VFAGGQVASKNREHEAGVRRVPHVVHTPHLLLSEIVDSKSYKLVPGGGWRTPMTLRSADFESVFQGFAEDRNESQEVEQRIYYQ
jgi:hypothetical protein